MKPEQENKNEENLTDKNVESERSSTYYTLKEFTERLQQRLGPLGFTGRMQTLEEHRESMKEGKRVIFLKKR